MAWQDVVYLFLDLPQKWTRQDENQAQLVDIMSYWLNAEYAKWTTDPEEAKELAKRDDKPKPPPFPIIEPVAQRPPAVHAAALKQYQELLEKYGPGSTAAEPKMPRAEWIAAMQGRTRADQ